MTPEKDFAGRQIIGTRKAQEDYYGYCELTRDLDGLDGLLLVLADGMGAYAGGGLASRVVVESFVENFCYARGSVPERLFSSLRACERRLTEEIVRQKEELREMGATLVAVVWTAGSLHWVSVGDSALYLYRQGTLKRINADHSMAPILDEQAAKGEITVDEAAKHPERGVLRAALADQKVNLYDLRQDPYELEKDDLIFAASDGLNTVKKPELESLIKKFANEPAEKIAKVLLKAVEDVGKAKQDNVTVAIIRNSAQT